MPVEINNKKNIGVILLAAGESARLGQPKQLLLYNGITLLQHSLQIAGASGAQPIVVVLGANAETIKREFDCCAAHIAVNPDWHEGIASSIRCGIHALAGINPDAKGTVLMVCDQPYVTSALLNKLMATHQETGKPIVACSYENTFGTPVFFHKNLFPELLQLRGDVGARNIIRQHNCEVEGVLFPRGNIDIDTEVDYKKL